MIQADLVFDLATMAAGGGSPEDTVVEREAVAEMKEYWKSLHEALDGLMAEDKPIDYDTVVEQIRAVNLVRREYL